MKRSRIKARIQHYETQIKEIKEELEIAVQTSKKPKTDINIKRLQRELQLHREGLRLYKNILVQGRYTND